MCGIIGAIAKRDVADLLLSGLQRLEYRGYDSAGIAILDNNHTIQRQRTQGKVSELVKLVQHSPMPGHTGIAHTRWATHGKPIEHNAHPHLSHDEIALVHNGIIENYLSLQHRLQQLGYQFHSETDTEIIAHLIHYHTQHNDDLFSAIRTAMTELQGAFALGIIHSKQPHKLIAIRQGSPLVIGLGEEENFIASDQLALLPLTQQFIYLENGDLAQISHDDVLIIDSAGQATTRTIHHSSIQAEHTEKGRYRHYMQKEIFEQAQAISKTLHGRIEEPNHLLPTPALDCLARVTGVHIVACGTSYHAAMVAKYWIEEWAKLPCQIEIASEYRYRDKVVPAHTLLIVISQSGETADTLAALRQAKQSADYLTTLALCNVAQSSLVHESDFHLLTHAGAEIGVASTKAFTTQLVCLLLLTTLLGQQRQLPDDKIQHVFTQLQQLPRLVEQTLTLDPLIKEAANLFIDKQHALYLGRHTHYAIALEGALKLKEISYIHAEGCAAGELKHGPLALVDATTPIVVIAPKDRLSQKLLSNIQEIKARGGQLLLFADPAIANDLQAGPQVIVLPETDPIIAPIIYSIPLQLLAYHVAILKGTDVDQPRNLAKSVTVE